MGADTIYLPVSVAPGETFDLALNMVAPDIDEDYSNFWRLRNPAGEIFGTTFSAIITVSSDPTLLDEDTMPEVAEPTDEIEDSEPTLTEEPTTSE